MNLKEILHDEIMPMVEKPSRYVGTEYNAVIKDTKDIELRVALVFPDLYDLGLGNVGILILYSILNDLPWCWCERAYAPAMDMEDELRKRDLPLFCNESKDSLSDMHMIGFTLQSELTYTNILTCIDLAGLSLRAEDRAEDAPLLFAGGPAVFNPEPLVPFFDFFVIGEGEDIILEIAETLRPLRNATRDEKLRALEGIEGIYIPKFYPFETLADGQVLPKEDAPKINKLVVDDLNTAKFPTDYIVPYTQQVHDRLALETLRGCTQGCRFCQAGMVTRPVRERTLENVDKLMEEALAKTGYEEVSLVSLSTCDYSRPRMLVNQAARRAAKDRVSVSLPSLRLDSFSVEMADAVADVRRSGLTFAPEAATPRLRSVINKWIPDEGLLDMAAEAYKRGWSHVKCYFMIGLPTERDEDIEAIVDLSKRTLAVGRKIKSNARVHLGVSTFVPKPFTPFQWAPQIGMEETERRQLILDRGFKGNGGIKFGRHTSETTFIEGLLARSDRRAADLLEAAWNNGARFESWDEHCNLAAWQKAIEDTGFDVEFAFRERDLNERLPWDHLDVLMPKEWMQEDWARAMELTHAPDCRAGKCHLCGVIFRERKLCQHMLKNQRQGRIDERDWTPIPVPEHAEPLPVQRLRFRIGRHSEPRFLSHLELVNSWIRTLRRAKAPLSYSQGFHAHPKVTFAAAAPVGEESIADYMDVILTQRCDPADMLKRVKAVVPKGIEAYECREVSIKTESLMSSVEGFSWSFHFHADDPQALQNRVEEMMAAEELLVERKVKAKKQRRKGRRSAPKQTREIDIRPMLTELRVTHVDGNDISIECSSCAHDGRLAKSREILQLLGLDPLKVHVMKRATHFVGDAATAPDLTNV